MDKLDIQILDHLQKNGQISLVDLAEHVASSRSAVWRRIQKLESDGVIRQHTALLDPAKVGLSVMVFAHVKMQAQNRDSLPEFIELVSSFPEVIECHTLMGDIDFILKVVVPDVQAYEDFFWNRLSRIDGVREISSSIALTAVKNTVSLPLGHLTV